MGWLDARIQELERQLWKLQADLCQTGLGSTADVASLHRIISELGDIRTRAQHTQYDAAQE